MQSEAPSGTDTNVGIRFLAYRWLTEAGNEEKTLRIVRLHRALPPRFINTDVTVSNAAICHLAPEGIVLGSLFADPRTSRPVAYRSLGNLRVAEQEHPVSGRGHDCILVPPAATDVVREFGNRFYLGLKLSRHEAPNLAGIHLLAELRLLPTYADIFAPFADIVLRCPQLPDRPRRSVLLTAIPCRWSKEKSPRPSVGMDGAISSRTTECRA